MICICVWISNRIWFWDIHIWKWRIWGFRIWICTMHIWGLRFRGWQIRHLIHCKKWGEALHHHYWTLHLKISASFHINLFRRILYFHYAYPGFRVLRYGKYIVSLIEWGVIFAPLLLSFSLESFCKFL